MHASKKFQPFNMEIFFIAGAVKTVQPHRRHIPKSCVLYVQ